MFSKLTAPTIRKAWMQTTTARVHVCTTVLQNRGRTKLSVVVGTFSPGYRESSANRRVDETRYRHRRRKFQTEPDTDVKFPVDVYPRFIQRGRSFNAIYLYRACNTCKIRNLETSPKDTSVFQCVDDNLSIVMRITLFRYYYYCCCYFYFYYYCIYYIL